MAINDDIDDAVDDALITAGGDVDDIGVTAIRYNRRRIYFITVPFFIS